MSFAYYNEIEPYAVEWLRNLRQHGHIADGHIDDRSIVELDHHAMLAASTQAHFFAGIGVWSATLRAAGWPDDAEVWTGSCPCQPFSSAGSRKGTDDERHLWPAWFDLICQHRPPVILGEQVASPDALAWFDVVRADLEGAGYAVAAFDLCAAGVGAPHIRQRLFFVGLANNNNQRLERVRLQLRERRSQQDLPEASRGSEACERMGNADVARSQGRIERGNSAHQRSVGETGLAFGLADDEEVGCRTRRTSEAGGDARQPDRSRATRGVGDSSDDGDWQHDGELPRDESEREERAEESDHASELASATRGFWGDAEWIPCRDGKWRPVEPQLFEMADGIAAYVGSLRAARDAQETEEEVEHQIEPRDAVRFLSSAYAYTWCGNGPAPAMQALLEAERQAGLMQHAPDAQEEIWRSLTQESQDRLLLGAYEIAVSTVGRPLAQRAPNRVGRLRAYGNAIVKPLAETFIRAIIDHIIET